jgi:transcriptional regulator with XRE-family HTH domain
MTCNQFNKALRDLGFTTKHPVNFTMSKGQTEFANATGISLATVKRWASGQWPVPPHVAALLHLMQDTGKTAKDLRT